MNCVIYARVSTDKQAEKELSIPAQLQAMRDYARQHEWQVVEEFTEPGASAKTTERPALQRLLARVKDGEGTIHGLWSIAPFWHGKFALSPERSAEASTAIAEAPIEEIRVP